MTDDKILKGLLETHTALAKEVANYLIDNLRSPILAIVRSKGGDEEDGADIFQITYIAATIAIRAGKYKREEKFKSWFKTIARNKCLDMLKNKRKLPNGEAPLENIIDSTEDDVALRVVKEAKLNSIHEFRQQAKVKDSQCVRYIDACLIQYITITDFAAAEGLVSNSLGKKLDRCWEKIKILLKKRFN